MHAQLGSHARWQSCSSHSHEPSRVVKEGVALHLFHGAELHDAFPDSDQGDGLHAQENGNEGNEKNHSSVARQARAKQRVMEQGRAFDRKTGDCDLSRQRLDQIGLA
jgi:hypothetical protein